MHCTIPPQENRLQSHLSVKAGWLTRRDGSNNWSASGPYTPVTHFHTRAPQPALCSTETRHWPVGHAKRHMETDWKHLPLHRAYAGRGGLRFTQDQHEAVQDGEEGLFYLRTSRPRASRWFIERFHLLFLLHFLVFRSTFFFYFFFLLFSLLSLQDNPFIFKGVHFGQSRNWKTHSRVSENTVPGNTRATTDVLSALQRSVKEHRDHLAHCRVLDTSYSRPQTQWPRYVTQRLPLSPQCSSPVILLF